jgi:hypothetical protein
MPWTWHVKNGVVYRLGDPAAHIMDDDDINAYRLNVYDTSELKSASGAGRGYAAFVLDRQGNIFSGQHVNFEFFHSFFTGGESVMAAGEIQVLNGKITALTPKSGHYHPGEIQLLNLLMRLKAEGVVAEDITVWHQRLGEGSQRLEGEAFLRSAWGSNLKGNASINQFLHSQSLQARA